jgi:hypothetical protein
MSDHSHAHPTVVLSPPSAPDTGADGAAAAAGSGSTGLGR